MQRPCRPRDRDGCGSRRCPRRARCRGVEPRGPRPSRQRRTAIDGRAHQGATSCRCRRHRRSLPSPLNGCWTSAPLPPSPETATPAISLIGRVIGDPNRTSAAATASRADGWFRWKAQLAVSVNPSARVTFWSRSICICRSPTTISEKTGQIEQLIAVVEDEIAAIAPLGPKAMRCHGARSRMPRPYLKACVVVGRRFATH